MTAAIDLDAYFAHIGYAGPRSATLATLADLHARHAESIPFENLNPLLGLPVRLDAASLERKLVREGRGGWCFEHNLLFSHALRALGFAVTWLAARVLWGAPAGVIPSRGHMLLRVDIDGLPYIADVGFGGLTLTAPLRLVLDAEQATPHEPFRLVRAGEDRAGEDYVLQAKLPGEWQTLYRFALHEQFMSDYEVSNWFLSHHPESFFVKEIIAARPDPDRRYALRNTDFTVRHLNGTVEKRVLNSAGELRAVLAGPIRIALPDTPGLDAALERIVASAAQTAAL